MRIFIDSANFDEIKACYHTGLIDGVTTNPSLIKRSQRDPMQVYRDLVALGIPDISMEVMGSYSEMVEDALVLHEEFDKVATIKLPMTPDGLNVCSYLNSLGIRTNVTLVFNAAQALLAAKAGATYVSPFVGRIDDQGYAGLEVVRLIAGLYAQTGQSTQVLAASIRTPHRVVRSFFNGASICTLPPAVFHQMYTNVLTDVGLDIFENDANS